MFTQRIFSLIYFFFIVSSIYAHVPLKIMTFNIEYGGHHVDFSKVIEAIKKANPDIVAIQETANNIEHIKEALGWQYANNRLQIISRLPLIDPDEGNGIYIFVEVEPQKVIALSNIHLPADPYGPTLLSNEVPLDDILTVEKRVRLSALDRCLEVLTEFAKKGIPTFLVGDFNCPSHLDYTQRAMYMRSHMYCAVEWPVSKALESLGFKDSYREVHKDEVNKPGLTWWAERPDIPSWNPDSEDPQDRIDFIYASGPVVTTDSEIIGEKQVYPWPSDHRAVMSTFDVQPASPPLLLAVNKRLLSQGSRLDITYHINNPHKVQLLIVPADNGSQAIAQFTIKKNHGFYNTVMFNTTDWKPQKYEALLIDKEKNEMARISFFIKKPTADIKLMLNKEIIRKDEPIIVQWKHAPGNCWDSIGIYQKGADPLISTPFFSQCTHFAINGQQVFIPEGELLGSGNYEAMYVVGDGFEALKRIPFTVI